MIINNDYIISRIIALKKEQIFANEVRKSFLFQLFFRKFHD
jgi:hypothetical protein